METPPFSSRTIRPFSFVRLAKGEECLRGRKGGALKGGGGGAYPSFVSIARGGKSRTGKLWEERERDLPKLHFTKDAQNG